VAVTKIIGQDKDDVWAYLAGFSLIHRLVQLFDIRVTSRGPKKNAQNRNNAFCFTHFAPSTGASI
jgi:hypothetical protein